MLIVALLGTCDSKLEELLYLRARILEEDCDVILIDVGRSPAKHEAITISQTDVCNSAKNDVQVDRLPRGELIKYMTKQATIVVKKLFNDGKIHGIIAAGGSGGTSLVAPIMREALPIGFPKLIVSTVASGDTGPLVGECDITMMYSVVDIAGSNSLLHDIFDNAAAAIVGMSKAYSRRKQGFVRQPTAKRVGITMFGVTTPCVDVARKCLEDKGYEVYVFHATGHGGIAMERLVNEGRLDAVLDITTTEICDHLMGGVMSAGPLRLEAAAKAGIPYVLSAGAMDMVNFGPRATVPEKFQHRKLYEHNPTVTLMRTNKDECRQVGAFMAQKLRKFRKYPELVKVVCPVGGVSLLSVDGAPFADEDANAALFGAISLGLADDPIEVVRDERDINDATFAVDIAERLHTLMVSS